MMWLLLVNTAALASIAVCVTSIPMAVILHSRALDLIIISFRVCLFCGWVFSKISPAGLLNARVSVSARASLRRCPVMTNTECRTLFPIPDGEKALVKILDLRGIHGAKF